MTDSVQGSQTFQNVKIQYEIFIYFKMFKAFKRWGHDDAKEIGIFLHQILKYLKMFQY